MAVRMRTVHKNICLFLWIAWSTGIFLLLINWILTAACGGITHEIFYSVVAPYNRNVMLLSLLPIEPLMLDASLVQDFSIRKQVKSVQKSLLYFAVTAVSWLGYIGLNILFTGI